MTVAIASAPKNATQIVLSKDLDLEYVDAQGDRTIITKRRGDKVWYRKDERAGWVEHIAFVDAPPRSRLGEVRYIANHFTLKSPVLYADKGQEPQKDKPVLVDGKYVGSYVGLVTTNEYNGTKMYKVWLPVLGAHSYSLTLQQP